jgi:chromosome segregation ATPase
MTRGETGILATGLADLRERQAVTETKLDAMGEAVKSMAAKLDTIIAGQEQGRTDRADLRTAIEELQSDVKTMKPDVATITDIKRAGRLGAWVIGGIAAIAASIATAKGWIILNFNYLFNR